MRVLALTLLLLARAASADDGPVKVSLALNADHASPLRALAFTPDGRKLLTVELQDIHLWDVATGERERTWRTPNELRKLTVSPEGKTAAVTFWGQSARVSVWLLDLSTGGSRLIHPPVFGDEQLAFSSDGKRLAIGFDGRALVWDLGTNQWTHLVRGATFADGVSFSRDGNQLLVHWSPKKGDDRFDVWDVPPAKVRNVPVEPKKPVLTFEGAGHRLAVRSPDGSRIAAWKQQGKGIEIGLWSADGKAGEPVVIPDFPPPGRLQFAGRDTLIVAAEHGGRVKACVLDLTAGKVNRSFDQPIHEKELKPLAVSADGKLLAAASAPGFQVQVFDLAKNRLVRKLGQPDPVPALVGFGADNRSIAWGFRQTVWPAAPGDLAGGLNLSTLEPLRRGSFKGFHLWRHVPPGLEMKQETAAQRADGKNGLTIVYRGKRAETEITASRSTTCYVTPEGRLGMVVGGASGGIIHVDGQTGKTLARFGTHDMRVDQMAVSGDGRYLLVARGNLALDLYRLEGKPELLMNVLVAGPDWIAWTPQGYYAATPGGERLIGWKVERAGRAGDFYPAEQFKRQMYRPDVIQLVLDKGNVEDALKAANTAREARKIDIPRGEASVEKLLPPTVTIEVDDTNRPRVKVKVTAKAVCKEQPIKSLWLFVGNQPVADCKVDFPAGKEAHEETWAVTLPTGRHTLSVMATSKDDTPAVSNFVEVVSPLAARDRPVIHHLAVGINEYDKHPRVPNLRYARDDAKKLGEAFKESRARGRLYQEASVTLLPEKATAAEVLSAIKEVRGKVKSTDLFVFSFAGHGMREEGEFYLLPHQADPTGAKTLAATAISGRNLRKALTDFPCQVLLMLDACHSGALGRGGSDEAARELSDVDLRATVMCAALGHEEAKGDREKGGYFTHAVVRALKQDSRAYDEETGELNVYHLQAFVYQEVKKVNGEQTPYLKMPLTQPAFVVAQFSK